MGVSLRVVVLLLAALVYCAWIRGARIECGAAGREARARVDQIRSAVYSEYADCAWDVAREGCSIPRATVAPPVFGAGALVTDARGTDHVEVAQSAWCALVGVLPDPLRTIGVEAAVAPAPPSDAPRTVDVIISRARLLEHESALARFRRQCECGWPWWRAEANFGHHVTYEFIRTGLRASALRAELHRAAPFYARFGGAVDAWVESVARPGGGDQMMSDHGLLDHDTERHMSLIVRYILVVYQAATAAQRTASSASPSSSASSSWFGMGAAPSAEAPKEATDAYGSFAMCMSEVQLTTWPRGDCDCVPDQALKQRLRETVDARMKKHFADSAAHVIRALPDAFDDQVATRAPLALPAPTGGHGL